MEDGAGILCWAHYSGGGRELRTPLGARRRKSTALLFRIFPSKLPLATGLQPISVRFHLLAGLGQITGRRRQKKNITRKKKRRVGPNQAIDSLIEQPHVGIVVIPKKPVYPWSPIHDKIWA